MARSQPIRRERRGLPLRAQDPARTPLRPRFAEYLAAKRKISARTRDDYQHPFDLYCRWLWRGGLAETLGSFTVEHLAAYADYLRERPAEPGRRPFDRDRLSVHSQHAYLRPLNQFGDYLAWAGWLEVNPFSETYESIMPTILATTRIIKPGSTEADRLAT